MVAQRTPERVLDRVHPEDHDRDAGVFRSAARTAQSVRVRVPGVVHGDGSTGSTPRRSKQTAMRCGSSHELGHHRAASVRHRPRAADAQHDGRRRAAASGGRPRGDTRATTSDSCPLGTWPRSSRRQRRGMTPATCFDQLDEPEAVAGRCGMRCTRAPRARVRCCGQETAAGSSDFAAATGKRSRSWGSVWSFRRCHERERLSGLSVAGRCRRLLASSTCAAAGGGRPGHRDESRQIACTSSFRRQPRVHRFARRYDSRRVVSPPGWSAGGPRRVDGEVPTATEPRSRRADPDQAARASARRVRGARRDGRTRGRLDLAEQRAHTSRCRSRTRRGSRTDQRACAQGGFLSVAAHEFAGRVGEEP